MKIIKAQDRVKPAIESFFKYYKQYAGKSPFYTQEKFDKISALNPETATPADIIREMNSSWVLSVCNECHGEFETVIEVGQEPDYESMTAYLCKDCAYKAFDMIAKAECGK